MPVGPAIAGEHLAAGGGGQQPGQARPQDIAPDQLEQSQAQHAADLLTAGSRLPAACRPTRARGRQSRRPSTPTPVASQRSCQVFPGYGSSQSSTFSSVSFRQYLALESLTRNGG